MTNCENVIKMKKGGFVLILMFILFVETAAGQCTADAGSAIPAICKGGITIGLGGSVGGDATGGIWSTTAGGNFNPGETDLNATWTPPAGYTGTAVLVLTATGGSCTTESDSKNVTVNALPVPAISGSSTANQGSTSNIYSTAALMTGYTWNISAGGDITAGSGTNSITVTWNNGGAQNVSVNYTDGNGCPGSTATVHNVTVNYLPVVSNIVILGNARSGLTLYASYVYNDAEGNTEGSSTYQWYTGTSAVGANPNPVSGANSNSFKLTDSQLTYYIGFSVVPAALSGATPGNIATSVTWVGPVVNSKPVAVPGAITGTKDVGTALTGHYAYSDTEGDVESGSVYKWYIADNIAGPFTSQIPSESGISHVITTGEQGKYFQFRVTPGAASGATPGDEVQSPGYGPANTKPYADNVHIVGAATIGTGMKGRFSFHDIDGDPKGTCTFRWLRNLTTVIPGATDSLYTVTSSDEGFKLTFEVTPVSSSGSPGTGTPVKSPETATITDPSTSKPVASDVCIQGIRAKDEILTGKYLYTYAPKHEGTSTYRWLRNNLPISGAGSKTYKLTQADIDSGEDIVFEVTPVSDNSTPKVGDPVKSDALSRIVGLAENYSIDDPAVTLTANIGDGVFSGPGVSSGIFTPQDAGTSGSPHTIYYYYSIVKPSNTCSQTASQQVSILSATASFSGFNNIYCHNGGKDTITVSGVPLTATLMTFRLTNMLGVVQIYPDRRTIVIDPGRMRPGNKIDTLHYSFVDGGLSYRFYRPLIIDSVGTNVALVNLDPAYCEGSAKRYISVEGTYPGGGSAIWTGALLSDKTGTSAFLDPLLGVPGTSYPVSYQYVSPNGCKSIAINRSVKINPLPDSDFTLDSTYNIDGGDKLLTSVTPDGNFVGPGVIGNKFYPAIAGQGVHEIKYFITDINNCSSNTPKTTTVRKVQGTYVNLPSIICYRDTTYNISVSGAPGGITILDFVNSKNSIVHTPGTTNAVYSVSAAGSGYDTVRFSYKWNKVDYTLSKVVFIDSIGKVAITGLKDNYCDYEGTVSLRVFVENSTGNGNFSFSGPDTSFTNYGNLADFYPSKTPTSATPYIVRYSHVSTVNNSGCRKKVEVPTYVNKSPTVSISTARTTVNFDEAPFILEGIPTNGIFSGKGIYRQGADYIFNPQVAGLGNIEVNFSFVDTKGCYAAIKDTLIVSVAMGTIEGINPNAQYCYDGADDTLQYVSGSPWLLGQFIGPGLTNISPDKAIFRPSVAGKGDHKIIFRYFDMMLTSFDVPAILKVDSIGAVTISNLNGGDIFCNNQPSFQLFGSPQGGVFTGPVTGSMLDPSKGIGNTSVGFTYTNIKTGCFSTIDVPILINPAPVISFVPADVCIENNSDTTRFINTTTSDDLVSEWLWEFTDPGGSKTSNIKEPGYLYTNGGLHKVILTAKTVNNCSAVKENTIDIGVKPVADFTWKNECFHSNDSIFLFDATVSSLVISRTWNFSDGGPLLTAKNPKYPKKSTGYLPVEYIVRTNYLNCHDTIFKNVYIRPTITIPKDGYSENFESGKNGWTQGYESGNTWTFGTPARSAINSAASGTNAWVTGFDALAQKKDSSSVVSPCFDFTSIERPMIGIWLWKKFDFNRDGAALQYKIGDSGTWEYVGTLEDGIKWYNSATIKGRPGGEQIGWTSRTSDTLKWAESRHKIDELEGTADVKFRIVYGSDGTSQYNDGIAFDDIWIGERTRNVLLEHFTNTSSVTGSEATEMINIIAKNNKKDVINIQYHTNFPGTDPYYDDNPGDASARILYYGLLKAPYSFIDGGYDKYSYANLYDYILADIDSNDVNRRSLINPFFKITLNSEISGGILTVNGQLTALTNINTENLTLYIAVTEKENDEHGGANGETTFYNVFRKFIPDAGGLNLNKSWTKGEVFTITDQSWVISNIKNSADIEVIAFVQNNISKELYQASSQVKNSVVVGIEDLLQGKGNQFALYPNPAVNKITVSFKEPLVRETEIKIYDLQGIIMCSFKAESGVAEYIIENPGLKPGIYLVRVSAKGFVPGFRKLIISD